MKPITLLAEKSNPNTVYTEQKQNKLQQTKHRGVYLKKKIPNTQTKTKPQQTKPSNPWSRRRSSLVVVIVTRPSSQIGDRRSEIVDQRLQIALPLLRCSVLPLALPQGISLFFSLTLSQSLSLFISLK